MSRFRMPKWVRRIIRRRVSEIHEDRALFMKKNLSLAYAFIAWNTLGYLGYQVYKGNITKAEGPNDHLSQSRQFAKLLKVDNAVMYRVDGLTVTGKFDLVEEFKKEESQSTDVIQDPEELAC